jgi:hypothetical protein
MLGALRRGAQLVTSSILSALGGKTFAQKTAHIVGVTEFTLVGPAGVVAVDTTMLAGATPAISLGGAASTSEGGYIAVIEPNFVLAGTPVAGLTQEIVDGVTVNSVDIIDLVTGEPVETPDGAQVFGLLQAWDDPLGTTVDGVAVAAAAVENLQISFTYWSKAVPAVLTAYNLPIGQYGFRPSIHHRLAYLSYIALLVGGDPLPDIATSVFHIPTFTGALYSDYPLGAVVVADDTGEERTVGPASWAKPVNIGHTVVDTATYDTTATDRRLAVTRTIAGACAITIRTVDIIEGREFDIGDEGYNAGTNNITIVGQAGELIQNQASLILNRDGESAVLYVRGGALHIR